MTAPSALERVIEVVLTVGVAGSGLLLLAGLVFGSDAVLRYGILVLMATPVSRVVVMTAGLLGRRDWVFGLISLWILGVVVFGMFVGR